MNENQSRMCGNGVGLGLFPSDSLKSQSYYFDGIEHDKLLYGVDSIKVLSNREIWRKSKSVQKLPFLIIFGQLWAIFSDPSHAILMPLRTHEHLGVYNDCAKFDENRINSF